MQRVMSSKRNSVIGEVDLVSEAESAAKAVVQNARLAAVIQHMRTNNISYIIGTFVAWQMGLLDTVITYGSGVCS